MDIQERNGNSTDHDDELVVVKDDDVNVDAAPTNSQNSSTNSKNKNNNNFVLTIHDKYSIHLVEDWSSGIGGGLWTTGLALAHYFTTPHFWQQIQQRLLVQQRRQRHLTSNRLRVLELGSGNGFLSVCLIVAIRSHLERQRQKQQQQQQQQEHVNNAGEDCKDTNVPLLESLDVVVTDTAEHLSLMERTMERNGIETTTATTQKESTVVMNTNKNHHPTDPTTVRVAIQEYLWGETPIDNLQFTTTTTNTNKDDCVTQSSKSSTQPIEREALQYFDLIIGSDLAYRDELHDPLIHALKQIMMCSSSSLSSPIPIPMMLLGVTMSDTKPIFFHKLSEEGFRYERLSDSLVESNFRGQQFGIFVIWRNERHGECYV